MRLIIQALEPTLAALVACANARFLPKAEAPSGRESGSGRPAGWAGSAVTAKESSIRPRVSSSAARRRPNANMYGLGPEGLL